MTHGFSRGYKVLTKEFSSILPAVHFDVIKNSSEFDNTMSYCVKNDKTRMQQPLYYPDSMKWNIESYKKSKKSNDTGANSIKLQYIIDNPKPNFA